MTKQEFAEWVMALKTYFPRENLVPNDKALELWYRQLQDIPYNVATVALNKWVALQRFSPTIADVREYSLQISQNTLPTWFEEWEYITDMVRTYSHTRAYEAVEEIKKHSKKTFEAMNQIGGFTHLCMTDNINVERANFRDVYCEIRKREMADRQLPEITKQSIATLINHTNNKMIGKE